MNETMENTRLKSLEKQLDYIKSELPHRVFSAGNWLLENDKVQVLSQGSNFVEFDVGGSFDSSRVSVKVLESEFEEESVRYELGCSCKEDSFCKHRVAVMLGLKEIIENQPPSSQPEGRQYTREGMIKRVLEERQKKAFTEPFRLKFSKNCHGEHLITTEKAVDYKLTFRNIEEETGYCSCPDYKKNKLGTCKHLIHAFAKFKSQKRRNTGTDEYPFTEVYLDPLHDYAIACFTPRSVDADTQQLIDDFFDEHGNYKKDRVADFLGFIRQAENFDHILIRPEVYDEVEKAFETGILQQIEQNTTIDLSPIRANLFPYQKEGIEFAAYKKGVIIADEMGLGKTLQAIGTAIVKKQLFDFKRTLVICPASLKSQWKKEIEKFSSEKATVVSGFPEEREEIYKTDPNYFQIINYETVLRDKDAINKYNYDFIILDEAQRIKNFQTITAGAIKSLRKKHGLVITGTPIENKLIDLYSIVEFLDDKLLTPMWEFSYQYCYFDTKSGNKITGYTNLQSLKERISPLLIRRTKNEVISQLHNLSEITIPIAMHPKQRELHASYAQGIASILQKKFKTSYDWQKLTMLLQSMRMVCNSTYLIDDTTNFSPKLLELKDVLFEKLNLANNQRKIIIFSEWVKSHKLIGDMLKEHDIGYTELTGKVPVNKRQLLIEEFERNEDCRVFLSTEAGGAGLNLQVADTVINFELPWNPAKKNQRIGRIDRLGQKNKELTVVNFLTMESIEMKIASGLLAKQELFDNVLNSDSTLNTVDFSNKGRAQFLQELEASIREFADEKPEKEPTEAENIETPAEEEVADLIAEEENVRIADEQKQKNTEKVKKLEEMETVMNKGMEFLSGMFKMATGNEMNTKGNRIEVDKETGEVVMRFKMEF